MTALELSWAAGLFEGEGTIAISKPQVRNWGHLSVSVTNTDRQILDWFHQRWPGYMKPVSVRRECREAWVWLIAARIAAGFLLEIRPYIVRDAVRAKIDVAMIYQAQKVNSATLRYRSADRLAYAEEQWNAYWYMGQLNQRGHPDSWRNRKRIERP